MNNYDRRPSFKERVAAFMMGRYGADELYFFIISLGFILMIINIFVTHSIVSYVLTAVEFALLGFATFRIFSKSIYKRQQENQRFLKLIEKPKKHINLQKCKIRDRKTHVYRKCPSCKNNLRLPKQKGKHTVVCPCCKNRFDVRI